MSENYFTDLAKVDVSAHIEKKGRFSYLSWAYAVAELKKRHPDATWEVRRFSELPYQKTDGGCMVEVAVTVCGITHSQIHPVLNGANKPIEKPNVFDINTSIQRALVKAIALHGLGLYIYAGEDLPMDEERTVKITPDAVDEAKIVTASDWFKKKIDEDSIDETHEKIQTAYSNLTNNERIAVDLRMQDKAPNSNKAYKNLLKEYLAYKPVVSTYP